MEQGANLRSSVHWANGVHEDELYMVSLIERSTIEEGIYHGTICKLKSDGMDLEGEGKLRILHHADRGKVND